jgi:hypothetical protein
MIPETLAPDSPKTDPTVKNYVVCPACGSATARSFRPKDETMPPRLDCSTCGQVVRHLPPPGDPDLPGFVFEPRSADAHAEELKPPPASWLWLGYIRPDSGRWYAVALAETLERCWDALLSAHLRGDVLCVPVKPLPVEEVVTDRGFVGWHRPGSRGKWFAVVEAASDGDCWRQLLQIRGGDKLVLGAGLDPNRMTPRRRVDARTGR